MDRLNALRNEMKEMLPEVDGLLALQCRRHFTSPHLFKNNESLDDLAIDEKYPIPLIVKKIQDQYPGKKLAVVCRGCEERGLVEMAKRSRINFEHIRIIGLCCTGEEAAKWGCHCEKPYPSAAAEKVIGDSGVSIANSDVIDFVKKSPEERLNYWKFQFSKCIKCYGCRDICPQCFCPECVLEDALWVERGAIPPDFPMFHLIRAMHTVGKCVSCRECTIACPSNIPLGTLYSLIRNEVSGLFGYLTGDDRDQKPPLVLPLEEGHSEGEVE